MYSAVVLEGVLAQLCAIGRVVHQAKFFATKYSFKHWNKLQTIHLSS